MANWWDDLFVTADDVAPFVPEGVLAESDSVLARLNRAVAEEWPQGEGATPPLRVCEVAIEAAIRILDNPKNQDSSTISSDGVSRTDRQVQRSGSGVRRVRVGLTAAEKRRIHGRPRRRLGTIRTPPRY